MRLPPLALSILLALTASAIAVPATLPDPTQPFDTHLIPAKTSGEIRSTAAEFLARHAKPSMDHFLFKQTSAGGELWTEVSGLRLARIEVQPVEGEAREDGVLGRYGVILDCTRSRTLLQNPARWSPWTSGRGDFLPREVVVERKSDGRWHPSIQVSDPLVAFTAQGNPDTISQQVPQRVHPRVHPSPAVPITTTPLIPSAVVPATAFPASLTLARLPTPGAEYESPAVATAGPARPRGFIPYLFMAVLVTGAVAGIPGKFFRRTSRPPLESQESLTLSRVTNVTSIHPRLL